MKRYGYDKEKKSCEEFDFNGCFGNKNNYDSLYFPDHDPYQYADTADVCCCSPFVDLDTYAPHAPHL